MTFSRAFLFGGLCYFALGPAAPAQDVQGLVLPLKQVSVASPVLQEVVAQVLVEEGDTVREGQVIVQLRAEKEALEVELSKKIVEQREFSAKGAEALAKDRMMSREAVLEKQTELELAKIKLATANVLLKEKTVRAPLDGIVVKKYKEAGESVDRVEKLVDIINIDQVYVQFYLDPKLLPSIKNEQPVTIRIPVAENAVFEGKVSFVDPRIDATSERFRVKVLVDNPHRTIKPGMRALADFAKLTAAK